MGKFKQFAQDFPTQGAGAVVGLLLIFLTGLAVVVRLALGKDFPAGYDTWIWALVAITGITTAGMYGKRATDYELHRIKASGPSKVSVGGPSDVTVEGDRG